MNMKYLIIFILIVGLIPDANAASTCTVRNSDCTIFGEKCLFSMYSENNAHVSECGMTYTWNVCCTPDLTEFTANNCYVNTTGNCNAGEGEIISLYNTTNSHAELYGLGNYNNVVCCDTPATWDSYDCHFNTTSTGCDTGETAVVSMYNYTNSHVGNISAYNNELCCKKADNTKPITIVTYPSIVPSSSITFNVNCTDTGGSGCDKTNISVYNSITGIYFDSCEASGFISETASCTMTLPECIYDNYNISINSTDKYGNSNYTENYGNFQVKLDDGCDCILNPTYCASSCVSGICSSSGIQPFVSFDLKVKSNNIVIGNIKTIYLTLQNPSYVPQSVPLYLGSFDAIKNWVWFDGHKYDDKRRNMTVLLGPKESQTVIVKVLGGKYGQYTLAVGSDDNSNNKYDELQINVVYNDDNTNIFSSTPGLSIISLFIIMLFGGFLRKSQ